jgi:shikimate 5-dehydrogenase
MQIDSINLGTLTANKKHNFVALVRNDSNFSIVITKLKVGCSSCTEATVRKYNLQPKEDVLMDVSYKPFSTGLHEKMITVFYTENNVEKEHKLIFNTTVK